MRGWLIPLAYILLLAFAILRFFGVGATAKCVDRTYSYSAHHPGTCSWHHGVMQWYR